MSTATINRIKRYIDKPHSTSNADTAAMYGDIVLAAMETMRGLMGSFDNELAFKAASAILELEKARLRHKTPLAGVYANQHIEQPSLAVEQPVSEEPQQQLSPTQSKQFEKAVDEFKVVLDRKQAEDAQPAFPRAVLREQCRIKMKSLGFDGFLDWIDLMVGRTEAMPTQPEPPKKSLVVPGATG